MAKTVAVVGASSDRSKFGNKALRAFVAEGYRVVPVNPNEAQVEGLPTYASVLDVPGDIDMATVYVQPDVTLRLLDEFERKAIPEIWIDHSFLFRETWRGWHRVSLNAAGAYGIDSFENLTAERIASLAITTAAAGVQIRLPSLSAVAAAWEHQWRSNDTAVDRVTVTFVQAWR